MDLNKKIMPDYKKIYTDIINKNFADKKEQCAFILEKQKLSMLDVIELNKKIFTTGEENEGFNQRHRSYGKSDILKILDYQKTHQLNNCQLAKHFKLSRNTVTKWKKLFI